MPESREMEPRGNLELSEEQSREFLKRMAKTDAQNAAVGVSGPEVAQYNLRVMKIDLAKRRPKTDPSILPYLEGLEGEHSQHPVTQKIRAYDKAHPKE